MLIGADPDQLDALANQMDSDAQILDAIRGRVGGVLEQVLWQGADAHEFFEEWARRFSGMMGHAVAGLRDSAQALHSEAVQQREASDVGAGSSILDPVSVAIAATSVAVGTVKKLDKVHVVAEELDKLGISDDDLRVADSLVAIAGAGFDIANFNRQRYADPKSAETLKAGVDAAFGVSGAIASSAELLLPVGAAVAGVEVAPILGTAALGFGVAELTNDAISTFDPRFDEQALHVGEATVSVVASGVKDAYQLMRRNPLNWVPVL